MYILRAQGSQVRHRHTQSQINMSADEPGRRQDIERQKTSGRQAGWVAAKWMRVQAVHRMLLLPLLLLLLSLPQFADDDLCHSRAIYEHYKKCSSCTVEARQVVALVPHWGSQVCQGMSYAAARLICRRLRKKYGEAEPRKSHCYFQTNQQKVTIVSRTYVSISTQTVVKQHNV